jgi:hypothetical protein
MCHVLGHLSRDQTEVVIIRELTRGMESTECATLNEYKENQSFPFLSLCWLFTCPDSTPFCPARTNPDSRPWQIL